jgi:hypothetical protein
MAELIAANQLKPPAICLPLQIPSRQDFKGTADLFFSEETAATMA